MAQPRDDFGILAPDMMELSRLSPSFEMGEYEAVNMVDESTHSMG